MARLLLPLLAVTAVASVDPLQELKRVYPTLLMIGRHNSNPNRTYNMKFNPIAALSPEKYKRLLGARQPDSISNAPLFKTPANFTAPDSVDWRDSGIVSPVKDQQDCGSCWAFSAVGALEGQHAKKKGELVEFSEQNLVDCSRSYGNRGCDGGWPSKAFNYVKENGGIDTEQSYPYEDQDDACQFTRENVGEKDEGFVSIPYGDEEALKNAVALIGPVSVAIDASPKSFSAYSSGVYYESDCSSSRVDHAVLVVGYGTDSWGGDYWIVKNSWAETWGDGGYIKMARNKNNNCAIASYAVYPIVN